MDNLLVISTKSTPEIIFIPNGTLMIKGCCRPNDPSTFYQPVFEWLKKFRAIPAEKITLIIDVNYIDTPSSRCILQIIKVVCELNGQWIKSKIIWKYEFADEDMLDQGKIFEIKTNFPFEFIEKPEE